MITLNSAPAAPALNPVSPSPAVADGTDLTATEATASDAHDAGKPATAAARRAFAQLLGEAMGDPRAQAKLAAEAAALKGTDAATEAARDPLAHPSAKGLAEDADERAVAADATAAALLASAQLAPAIAVITPPANETAIPASGKLAVGADATGVPSAAPRAPGGEPGARIAEIAQAGPVEPAPAGAPEETRAADARATPPRSARELSAARDLAASPDGAGAPDPLAAREATPSLNTPTVPATPVSMAAASAPSPASQAPATAGVAAPVHSAEFPREFATQVQFAVQRGVEQASIAVNPPELGPIAVRIELSNGEARVHVAAEAAATREAIAESMPRLRELLGSQGITLADGSSVGTQLPQRDPQAGANGTGARAGTSRGTEPRPDTKPVAAAPAARVTVRRLLDVYA